MNAPMQKWPPTLGSVALAVGILCAFQARCWAGDWPGWRGPTGLGYTEEKDLPLTWNGKTGQNILWKSLLHGGGKNNPEFSSPGWSSPIVWKGRIFLTTATWPSGLTEKERRSSIAEHHVLCFQVEDGKQLWDTVVLAGKIVVNNFYHGYTVPTPATDGTLVFALFGSGVLAALDFEGTIVWREELPYQRDVDGGICSSPILYEDTVIVPGIQDMGLRALEKKTGKVKWEQKTKQRNTMSTPALIKIQGQTQLIHYAGGIQGIDPATGTLVWSCKAPTSQSSPAFGSGLLYADSGRGGQLGVAVDPTGKGEVTKTHVKWETRVEGVAGSSAIIVGARVYRSSGSDFIKCWALADGELVYEEKTPRVTPSASPIATPEGRIYFAGAGKSYVIKAGPKFESLATNDLGDGDAFTTPAVSGGRIFIKGKSYLWSIGTPPASAGDAIPWNKVLAGKYLDGRARAWFEFSSADRGVGADKISCISCHSLLPFALARPALRKLTGTSQPTTFETRLMDQTKNRVNHWQDLDSKKYRLFYDFSEQKKKESWGTEAVLNSLVLAFDDNYQGRKVPADTTRKAFANLWQVQSAEGPQAGSWDWLDFGMDPWESKESRYFGAALAAIAVGTAPGYYTPGADADLDKKALLLRGYLRGQLATQSLNNRIWMLWASAKLPGLLTKEEQKNLSEAIFQKQQPDGGWSLSSLGTMTRSGVPDAGADGYATGLTLHVLQTAGVPKNDPRLAKGLTWLRAQQSRTGEWRASSVNKIRDPDSHAGKFMSDAATAYAVLALSH